MKATTTRSAFSRETTIRAEIHAPIERVWSLLTNTADYPLWNSTVISIKGLLVKGGSILLKSKLAPKRVFRLQVLELEPNRKIVWGDTMGRRTFELLQEGEGTRFSMSEKIGGPLFPLFSKMIPSFDQSFEDFARDLKKAAEN